MSDSTQMTHRDDTGSVLLDPILAILGCLTMDKSYDWWAEWTGDREAGE